MVVVVAVAALLAAMKPKRVLVDVGHGARFAMLRPILVTAARADARVLLVEGDAPFIEAVEVATVEPSYRCIDCGSRRPEWLREPACEGFLIHVDATRSCSRSASSARRARSRSTTPMQPVLPTSANGRRRRAIRRRSESRTTPMSRR